MTMDFYPFDIGLTIEQRNGLKNSFDLQSFSR